MNQFETIIKENYIKLDEQGEPMAPPAPGGAPAAAPEMGADPGGMPPDMSGGMGEPEPPAPEEEMDNGAKKKADPIAYTESMLKTLVDADAGINPEEFADYIDTFGLGLAKIKDKEGFKRFYKNFYNQIAEVVKVGDKLKNLYTNLHNTLQDVLATQDNLPDTAGGEQRQSNLGPGVQ